METIVHDFITLCEQAYHNWVSGGWCMPPMAVNALVMFALGIHVYLKQRQIGFMSVSEKTWRRWLNHPAERKGPIGEIVNFVTAGASLEETDHLFNEARASEIVPFERDLRIMGICTSAAPLIGLLGTVTGMLTLFAALARGSGGDETMKLIAEGVSEALIATQTGLVIALPGLIFHHYLARQHERFKALLEKIKTVCIQDRYKKIHLTEALATAGPS